MRLLLTQDVPHSCGRKDGVEVTMQYVPRSWCSAEQLQAWDAFWSDLLRPIVTAKASEPPPPAVAQEPRPRARRKRSRRHQE
jgi:hypothetical protein